MKKRVYKYKLRRPIRRLLIKLLITLVILIVDVVLYHYLGIAGSYVGENTWANTFCFVGWFWLLAGQFGILYTMWEN